jgi:hypothetical protein
MWHAVVANNVAVRAGGFVLTDYFEYSSDYFIETRNNHVGEAAYYGTPGFSTGRNIYGVQGAHLNPLGLFLTPLGLFLRTSIPLIWRILSAFLRA